MKSVDASVFGDFAQHWLSENISPANFQNLQRNYSRALWDRDLRQNHYGVLSRMFPRMTSLVRMTPPPWELPQWSVAAPTHPSTMSTTLVM